MLAARQDAAAAQKRLAELDEQAAAKRRTALEREIVDIRAVTAERLKLIDALIEGEKAREGGARAGVLSGLRRRRADEGAAGEDRVSEAMAAAARAADKAVADRAAEAAAIRLDAEKSLQSEIARLEIAATMKGHDKKMALLALEEKAALAAAAAEGVDEALIRRKYEMLRRLADAGRGAEAAAPKLSTTGMFDASHVGQMSGGSMAQRQAKAAERAAAGIERLLEKADAGELVLQFV